MTICNFFKIDNRWVRVYPRIKEKFHKMYQPTEGIMLDTVKAGDAFLWPEPIFIESEADLMKFALSRNEEHLLDKAFDTKKLGNVRAKLLVKQIRNTSKDRASDGVRAAIKAFLEIADPRVKDWLPAAMDSLFYYASYHNHPYFVMSRNRKNGKLRCFGPADKSDIAYELGEIDPVTDDIEAILNIKEGRCVPFVATVRKMRDAGPGDTEYKIKWK